jgi:mercuric ion binding protein
MKKLIVLLILVGSFAFASEIKTTSIKTSAECSKCKARIEKAVNGLDGVKSSSLDVKSKVFTVSYYETIDLAKINKTINNVGYDADSTRADETACKKLPKCCKVDGHK